jgi:hypothetical protein
MASDKELDISSDTPSDSSWTPQIEEFKEHRERVWEDRQASADAFDKALLTFSSGTLALSLAFIKDLIPLAKAVNVTVLFASWAFFLLCIVITILSFRFSIAAMDRQLIFLEKYYLEGNKDFLNPRNSWSKAVNACAITGAVFFFAGLLSTVIFVYSNTVRIIGK